MHTWANGDGTQRIEDTGPLTKKRMETCDEEFRDAAIDFIKRQHEAETPFFVWFNSTHMHFRTHPKPESIGRAGRWQSEYHDTMLDHDDIVGDLLTTLDELGIADDTIVMYSTDNGPHMNSWPDAGMTPFRNEKNSNWEGAYRVPAMVRWPGHIPAGTVLNGIVSHNDWFVTLLAAAGEPDIAEKLKAGTDLNGTTFKVHLDGHNQLDYITGAADESPRKHFFYVSDDGDLTGLRFDNWKIVFMEQRQVGTLRSGWNPTSCYAGRNCSTCGPTRTSGPTSRRTPTSTGCWTGSSCSPRRRPTCRACCRRSSSSRSDRSRPVSTSSR